MVTSEQYAAAKKKASTLKSNSNFMVIEMQSYANLVLPYADGVAFMACLANAECFSSSWSNRRLQPFSMDTLQTKILSNKERDRFKLAALLNVDVGAISDFEDSLEPT